MKTSRFLARVDSEIASAPNAVEADCKRAERAGYRARQGFIDEAKATLALLHQRYDRRPNAAVSAWISLAEGFVSHYSEMGPAAHDKMKRAYALSRAAGLTQLHALSAAWLAHIECTKLEFRSVAAHVSEALTLASDADHSVRSRANLVMAQALHMAMRPELALPWYTRARQHAVSDGDDTTLSALMHNMAWLRMSESRQLVLNGHADLGGGVRALTSAESNAQYDRMVGVATLDVMKPILRAQILSLQGRPGEALALYESHLGSVTLAGTSRFQGNLFADQAWCKLCVGRRGEAIADALRAEAGLTPDTQLDDRAAAHSRLGQVYAELGDAAAAEHHRQLASDAWDAYEKLQVQIVESLARVSATGVLTPAVP